MLPLFLGTAILQTILGFLVYTVPDQIGKDLWSEL
jgi:hypothetical protein